MAQCQVCKLGGANMKQCKTCGQVWCLNCIRKGKGNYPKPTTPNKCPYCGKLGVKSAQVFAKITKDKLARQIKFNKQLYYIIRIDRCNRAVYLNLKELSL